MRKFAAFIFCFILLESTPGYTQTTISMNAANIQDPRLLLVNPAAMTFHGKGMFVSGYKLYYLSLGDEHPGNFYSGFSYRLFKKGIVGITSQLFHAGTFRQTQVDVNYAISLWNNRFKLGGRAGILGVSYNTENFRLNDIYDPLLHDRPSKCALNLGAGIFASLVPDLYLGFSANHLNRPSLSLTGSNNKMFISTNLSLLYWHRIFRPQVSFEREDDEAYVNFGLESWLLPERAFLRGSYCSERLTFGAGYNFGKLCFNYEYDYYLSDLQQVSNGSHQIAFSFRFGEAEPVKITPLIKIKYPKKNFKIKIEPIDSITCIKNGVCFGQEALYRIYVLPIHGFAKPVKLSLENVPPDLSFRFSVLKITSTETCTLRVTPGRQLAPGSYPLTVRGKAACKKHRDSSIVRVRLPLLVPKIYSLPTRLTIAEKHRIVETNPPLNYIFFDSSATQIPTSRYAILDSEQAAQTSRQYFNRLTTISEQYRHVLNLFGWRLKENPAYKVLLVGCNSGVGVGKGNLALSRNRARSVKNYFLTVWGISSDRIEVMERNLPSYPSTLNDPRGLEENHRVEIQPHPGSEKILSADTATTVEIELSDSVCVFDTHGTVTEAGVKSWQLVVKGNDGTLLNMSKGDTTLPPSETWDWREAARNAPSCRDSLTFCLSVSDNYGQDSMATGVPIRVHRIQQDTLIDRSRLLFFAFDSFRVDLGAPRLQVELQKIVAKFKKHKHARVEVRGYTDVIGDSTFNLLLSKLRAEEVKKALVELGIPEHKISAQGFGEKFPIMTNELPEGRMMNRRVEVDVIYPT